MTVKQFEIFPQNVAKDGTLIIIQKGLKLYNISDVVDLLNTLHEENIILKSELSFSKNQNRELRKVLKDNRSMAEVVEENRALKQVIKEVLELLEEEVDLFSDKATEHDINAYIELRELDNKDAYYMAISTKKAIKLLKEMM